MQILHDKAITDALTKALGKSPIVTMLAVTQLKGCDLAYGVCELTATSWVPFSMRVGRNDLHLWKERRQATPNEAAREAATVIGCWLSEGFPGEALNPHKRK